MLVWVCTAVITCRKLTTSQYHVLTATRILTRIATTGGTTTTGGGAGTGIIRITGGGTGIHGTATGGIGTGATHGRQYSLFRLTAQLRSVFLL